MTEQEKDKQARIILEQLLTKHFFGAEFEWPYLEGTTLQEVDRELWIQIVKTLKGVI